MKVEINGSKKVLKLTNPIFITGVAGFIAVSYTHLMGAITNVVMNYILIKYVGVLGATVATAISSFVIFSMRKHAAKSLLEFKALRNGYISWCILIVQALLEIKYQNYIVGFVGVIAICILNLKNLLELTRHYSVSYTHLLEV